MLFPWICFLGAFPWTAVFFWCFQWTWFFFLNFFFLLWLWNSAVHKFLEKLLFLVVCNCSKYLESCILCDHCLCLCQVTSNFVKFVLFLVWWVLRAFCMLNLCFLNEWGFVPLSVQCASFPPPPIGLYSFIYFCILCCYQMSFWLFFVQDFSYYNGYFLKFFVDINFFIYSSIRDLMGKMSKQYLTVLVLLHGVALCTLFGDRAYHIRYSRIPWEALVDQYSCPWDLLIWIGIYLKGISKHLLY